jgi:hypothetical protein
MGTPMIHPTHLMARQGLWITPRLTVVVAAYSQIQAEIRLMWTEHTMRREAPACRNVRSPSRNSPTARLAAITASSSVHPRVTN